MVSQRELLHRHQHQQRPCWTPAAAVATLFFLFALRTAEHAAELKHRATSVQPAEPHAAPDMTLSPPPATPIAWPAASLSAEQLQGLPLHARPLPEEEARQLWQPEPGTWLSFFVASPVPARRHSSRTMSTLRGCPGGCGGEGTCHHELGQCICSSGRRGAACEQEERWECNAPDGRYMWSRCAGECDTRYGYCYCGARGAFPERPLLQCEPIGIERVVSPWKVEGRNAAERFAWEKIWGGGGGSGGGGGGGKGNGGDDGGGAERAWCDAAQGDKPAARCACRYDGYDGYLCQHPTEQFCLNQCSGRGSCRFGFCLCDGGAWGVDCSLDALTSPPSLSSPSSSPPSLLPSSRGVDGSSGIGAGAAETAVGREGGPAGSRPNGTRTTMEAAPTRRLRPLIYVYEMPSRLTTDLLQRRHDKLFCVPRTYLQRNATQYAYGIYQGYVLELLIHEWLLSSPHRTTDPTEADWFFVPVYASCMIVTHIFETPSSPRVKFRVARAAAMYVDAHAHIRDTYPFWNASGGRDHVWVFGYDEGACFAPVALRPSVLISHWGNTMTTHARCTTTYDADRWDPPTDPWSNLPLSSLRGDYRAYPCHDPTKDIVMPSFKDPRRWAPEPQDDPTFAPRRRLFFFSGDLGSPPGAKNAGPHVHANYSLGLRQAAWRAVQKDGDDRLEVTGHLERDWWHTQYAARLRSSVFCGAFPGDGWSGGISSAVLAGGAGGRRSRPANTHTHTEGEGRGEGGRERASARSACGATWGTPIPPSQDQRAVAP